MYEDVKWSFSGYELDKISGCVFHRDGDDCFIQNNAGLFSVSVQSSVEQMDKSNERMILCSQHGIKLVLYFQNEKDRPFVLFQIQYEKAKPLYGQIVFKNEISAREGIEFPIMKKIFESITYKANA